MSGSATRRRSSGPLRPISGTDRTAFPIPDPRTWPTGVRRWFASVIGEHDLMDVFIFDAGQEAFILLEDAVTALGFLPVTKEDWGIDRGYPVLQFCSSLIPEYAHQLMLHGYNVRVLHRVTPARRGPVSRERGAVIDISTLKGQVE